MIICPNCKEEIDDDSHYCDQCGKALFFCNRCGRVGMGRRCTNCGGLMVTPDEFHRASESRRVLTSVGMVTNNTAITNAGAGYNPYISSRADMNLDMPVNTTMMPRLMLYNSSLNIRIEAINGAVIGRKQGPYTQFFQNNMYVSGVHAQLMYKAGTGWCIIDRHSSNGTKLNEHLLQPDIEMSVKNGDIITIANVNLQIIIN